jgi:hypothetical protein
MEEEEEDEDKDEEKSIALRLRTCSHFLMRCPWEFYEFLKF